MTDPLQIYPLEKGDRDWVARFTAEHWGAEIVVAHGIVYRPAALPGFVAWQASSRGSTRGGGERVGLVTFHLQEDACEIVTLNSLRSGRGVGSALIARVKGVAREAGCRRLWVITTNDNLEALGFYQKRGFSLVAVHRNALQRSRQVKPEIPLIGQQGIPLRDEIELEMLLE